MLPHDVEIHRPGMGFTLHPEGALFWQSRRWLVVADPDLRDAEPPSGTGMPLPGQAVPSSLARLGHVLDRTRPDRMVILGGRFHARPGAETDAFRTWCRLRAEDIHLVLGRRDLCHAKDFMEAGLTVHQGVLLANDLLLCADPDLATDSGDRHPISGRERPGVLLEDDDGRRFILPCFLIGPRSTVLPAFGPGEEPVAVRPGLLQRVFACTARSVLDVTGVSAPIGSRTR